MTVDELEMIAQLCRKHDVIVVSDEVYEWLVYPPQQHVRIGQSLSLFHVYIVMDALRSRCGHYIFALWFLSFFLA